MLAALTVEAVEVCDVVMDTMKGERDVWVWRVKCEKEILRAPRLDFFQKGRRGRSGEYEC